MHYLIYPFSECAAGSDLRVAARRIKVAGGKTGYPAGLTAAHGRFEALYASE